VHISQLADRIVKNPGEIVKAGDMVQLKIRPACGKPAT